MDSVLYACGNVIYVCKADHNVFKLDGGGRSSEWGVSEGTVR